MSAFSQTGLMITLSLCLMVENPFPINSYSGRGISFLRYRILYDDLWHLLRSSSDMWISLIFCLSYKQTLPPTIKECPVFKVIGKGC